MRFTYLKNIAFFRKKKQTICSPFEVLITIKTPSLMLIFSSYIAICSQALKIILYQREKRYLLKKKHLKTHQIGNRLKLCCSHTEISSIVNMPLLQNDNHIIFFTVPKVFI